MTKFAKACFIAGACEGAAFGHAFGAALCAAVGYRMLALGVFLLGLGWVAARAPWQRIIDGASTLERAYIAPRNGTGERPTAGTGTK